MKTLKPLDFLIFLIIIGISIFFITTSLNKKGDKVVVQADNQKYEYSLSTNGTYRVEGSQGYTTFQIRDKKVRIIDSACPNKTCVQQGWTSPIVCLPNNVIISIESEGEFDAVTQ